MMEKGVNIIFGGICWIFLCRYQTVEKLQQSYIFIPSKYKVISIGCSTI